MSTHEPLNYPQYVPSIKYNSGHNEFCITFKQPKDNKKFELVYYGLQHYYWLIREKTWHHVQLPKNEKKHLNFELADGVTQRGWNGAQEK